MTIPRFKVWLAVSVFAISYLVQAGQPVLAETAQQPGPATKADAPEMGYSEKTPGFRSEGFMSQNKAEFFDPSCSDASAGGTTVTPGQGAPDGMTFPNLDPGKMADAINKYVNDNKGPEGSILEGVGEKAVASGKKANVNPFLVIAHAKYESEMGSKVNANVKNANNSFGRSATASQPNWSGSRLWYKWSSGEASVDASAPENNQPNSSDQYSYIREVFSKELDSGDWKAYFEKYAPVADSNANNIYHPSDGSDPLVLKAVKEMAAAAGGSTTSSDSGSSSSDQCCATGTGSGGAITGDTPVAKLLSYLTGKGFTLEQAAGVAGNLMQESGGQTENLDPKATNGSHWGIAQWDSGRYGNLQKYAKSPEKATDLETQIKFIGVELGIEGNEGDAGFAAEKKAHDSIKNAKSPEDAARAWNADYERSGEPGEERLRMGREIAAKYGDGKIKPTSSTSSDSSAAQCGGAEASSDFVYYNQGDPAWNTHPYPPAGNIGEAGCGATSVAMIIATKKDKNVKPPDTADWISQHGFNTSGGTSFAAYPAVAEHYGMKSTDIGTDFAKAKDALRAGHLLIVSGQGGDPFTSGGHLVVGRGVTDDGKIIIANPAPNIAGGLDQAKSKPYTDAQLTSGGLMKFFVFE